MSKNITAVEWLEKQMTNELKTLYKYKIKQAKEMEKQQIIDACKKGYGSTAIFRDKLAEQYYQETFKSE